jgi:YjbE family integral membrane protein
MILQIIVIDILLSGDNAIVIAAACKHLPDRQRDVALRYGAAGAIVLRVALIFVAQWLLDTPMLKLVGGILLAYIAIKLLRGGEEKAQVLSGTTPWAAIVSIIIADASMSMDNVIAIAAAARGHTELVAVGVAISIPLLVYGSRVIMWLMDRSPLVITLGAVMLGWIAGGMAYSDSVMRVLHAPEWGSPVASLGTALAVLLLGVRDEPYGDDETGGAA